MNSVKYKGKTIHPYESFYWNTTKEFFRGELGGGIARCVKCDDCLATMVMEEIKVKQVMNIVDDTNIGFKNPQRGRVYSVDGLSPCIYCYECGGLEPKVLEEKNIIEPTIMAMRGRKEGGNYKQKMEMNENGTSNTLTGVQKDNLVVEPKVINPLKGQTDNGWHYEQQVYADEGITRAMKAGGGSGNIPKVISELTPKYRIRKLTPKECFRLMGVDDADIDTIQASGISNSSQYKLAGNSIVVDVLYHIFRKAFIEKENDSQQLTLF